MYAVNMSVCVCSVCVCSVYVCVCAVYMSVCVCSACVYMSVCVCVCSAAQSRSVALTLNPAFNSPSLPPPPHSPPPPSRLTMSPWCRKGRDYGGTSRACPKVCVMLLCVYCCVYTAVCVYCCVCTDGLCARRVCFCRPTCPWIQPTWVQPWQYLHAGHLAVVHDRH
jgi:hypothetical protein